MKIVHLSRDSKFAPLAQSLFEEAFPGANTWLVRRPAGGRLQHITDLRGVEVHRKFEFSFPRWCLRPLRTADLIVVHGMRALFARALRGVPPGCMVMWIGWGFDYYPLLQERLGGLLLPRTAALEVELGRGPKPAGQRHRRPIERVAPRIDVFSVNPSEVGMLRDALPALRAAFHCIPSFTVEDVFERGPARMEGPDILLGNSAAPSNNHLEAFDALAPMLRGDDARRVIVPLSYGAQDYADRVESAGRACFGDRFVPLRQWLPIEEYNARVQRCGIVFMNHRRQQAVGNIGAGLYKGAKVLLRRENPLFGFYRSLGAVVHAADALDAGDCAALAAPTAAEQDANRDAVRRRWGRAQVLAAVRALADYRRT